MQKLIHGDCLEVMADMQDESVDMVLTDPPYGINYKNRKGVGILNDKRPFIWWLYGATKKLKVGGCLILFCRHDVWATFEIACYVAGLEVKSQIIWDKKQYGQGDCLGTPSLRHELVLFATKGRFKFHAGRPHSILTIQRVPWQHMVHPNEKPVSLMEHFVEYYCPPSGTVFDPFTGVSPVGVACKKLDRHFIGIELDKHYYDIARSRICLIDEPSTISTMDRD